MSLVLSLADDMRTQVLGCGAGAGAGEFPADDAGVVAAAGFSRVVAGRLLRRGKVVTDS
jgi:hypothetical protein